MISPFKLKYHSDERYATAPGDPENQVHSNDMICNSK